MLETKKNKIYEDQRIYQEDVTKLKNQYQIILKNMKDTVKRIFFYFGKKFKIFGIFFSFKHEKTLNDKNNELQCFIDEINTFFLRKR